MQPLQFHCSDAHPSLIELDPNQLISSYSFYIFFLRFHSDIINLDHHLITHSCHLLPSIVILQCSQAININIIHITFTLYIIIPFFPHVPSVLPFSHPMTSLTPYHLPYNASIPSLTLFFYLSSLPSVPFQFLPSSGVMVK